jgi:hypothetical protein
MARVVANFAYYGRVRASLLNADPLSTALGRPNREQVMTTRASAATTLQALELTNGSTLAQRLAQGAEQLMRGNSKTSEEIISEIYENALGRAPGSSELENARELLGGTESKQQAVEDLLWAVTMLPEFQLIY